MSNASSNLNFVGQVVYDLKVEYGEMITVGNHAWTQDQSTGIKTDTPTTFVIGMAVPMPENLRLAFLKSVGVKKEGVLEKGQRQFLIDKADIPAGQSISRTSFIDYNNKRADVGSVDDYEYALVVTTVAATGNPTS